MFGFDALGIIDYGCAALAGLMLIAYLRGDTGL